MAEGYIRHYAGERAEVCSAGILAHGVHPLAITVMQEDGVDISAQTSNRVEEYTGKHFDWVITVCDHAKEHCPWFPFRARFVHHNFTDPAKATGTPEEILQQFRRTRAEIRAFCEAFVREHVEGVRGFS